MSTKIRKNSIGVEVVGGLSPLSIPTRCAWSTAAGYTIWLHEQISAWKST